MQWLETFLLTEAIAGFVLASMNCRFLLGYARAVRNAARRTGARALALVCAALALEALAFMASPALEASPRAWAAGALLVRSSLLAASGVLSLLLLRAGRVRP